MKKSASVYLVHHTNPKNDDVKFIGVYSTRDKAKKAIQSLKIQPGFNSSTRGFKISEQELDRTWWEDGFVTWKEALDSIDDGPVKPITKKSR